MKLPYAVLIFLVLFFSIDGLKSQSIIINSQQLPFKSSNSVLFGKDIIISDHPDQDQQKVKLCYAFNGWIYAAIAYTGGAWGNVAGVTILKSVDNGINWTVVLDGFIPGPGGRFASIDILTTGDSVSNLKVILAGVVINIAGYTLIGNGFIYSYYEETGLFASRLFESIGQYAISLASDALYPASNSNPHSIGALYSQYQSSGDSIIFLSSSNGGISFDGQQGIVGTGTRCHKVALTYGRSPSWNSGRYFAAWEEQDNFGLIPGHIYTSHSNPDFNSPFTAPVNIDGLDAADYNMCSDPAIACQYNNADNDSSNLSEIILFNRYNSSNQSYNVRGYYNLQAANHIKFKKLILSDSAHNNLQPDINFNPYDSTFMVTYYDSTEQKLPFLINNYNLNNPNQWTIVSSGYNDSPNLSSPYPIVEITPGLQNGANVWISKPSGGFGVAMFDAPSSNYTGISGNYNTINDKLLGAYPNPCREVTNIGVELKKPGKVNITLYDLCGQSVGILTDQYYSSGKHDLRIDVSKYLSGTYIYKFQTSEFTASGRLIVIK